MTRTVKILGIFVLAAVTVMYLEPWKSEFERERENVQKAFSVARVRQTEVSLFYQENNRMPTAAEAKAFSTEGDTRVNTAVYDADKKRVVVTSTFGGRTRQFAMHAEENKDKDAIVSIRWTCRTIDFDVKDLPFHCNPAFDQ